MNKSTYLMSGVTENYRPAQKVEEKKVDLSKIDKQTQNAVLYVVKKLKKATADDIYKGAEELNRQGAKVKIDDIEAASIGLLQAGKLKVNDSAVWSVSLAEAVEVEPVDHAQDEAKDEVTFNGKVRTATVYQSGKYHLVDIKSPKLNTTDWSPSGKGYKSREDAIAAAKAFVGVEEASVEEEDKFAGWIAIYNGKKLEIRVDKDAHNLLSAKEFAIKTLKVPKSKQGLIALAPAYEGFESVGEAKLSPDAVLAVLVKRGANPKEAKANVEKYYDEAVADVEKRGGKATPANVAEYLSWLAQHNAGKKESVEVEEADLDEQQKGTFKGWRATVGKKTLDVGLNNAKSMWKALEFAVKKLGLDMADHAKVAIEPVYEDLNEEIRDLEEAQMTRSDEVTHTRIEEARVKINVAFENLDKIQKRSKFPAFPQKAFDKARHEFDVFDEAWADSVEAYFDESVDEAEITEWTNQEIKDMFDSNPNMTLAQLASRTGMSVAQLKKILMEAKSESRLDKFADSIGESSDDLLALIADMKGQ